MLDKLKQNWFVVLVAVILVGACGYYAYDQNKGKLPGKTVDDKDVIVEIDGQYINADDLYNDLYGNPESKDSLGTQVLYSLFERAIVEETVTLSDEETQEARQMAATTLQNFQVQYPNNWEEQLLRGLQASGYSSVDDLEAYFTQYLKIQKLVHDAYDENLEELFTPIYDKKSPRTVSHILVKMADKDNPSEEEQAKVDAVDAALSEGKDFAEVAKEYSDDSSAANGGALGYADADTKFVSEFLDAMLKAEKGVATDWVKTTYGWHKILVTETDKAALLADESLRDSIYSAIDSYYPKKSTEIIWNTAKDLNITFEDEKVEKALKEYMGVNE